MYIPDSNPHEIINAIEELNVEQNETVLIMLAEQQLPNVPYLISELNKKKINFLGGIFPGLIHGTESYYTGAIVSTLPVVQQATLIQGGNKTEKDMQELLESIKPCNWSNSTAFIISDFHFADLSILLTSIFSTFADSLEYIGCGAGFLDMERRPCILTPDGFFEDAAVIVFLDMKCSLGVHHGWEKAIGPLVVTKSEGILIKELNWRNASEVYREIIEADTGKRFDQIDFYEISSHYPFGIYTEGGENFVREVFTSTEKGDLLCAGSVPEHAVVNILKGENSCLINAAKEALDDCFISDIGNVKCCLLMDCIGRELFLKEDFNKELETIANGLKERNIHIIPEGVLSMGEIASMGGDLVEFLNKTVVVGVFHESSDTVH